MKKKLIIIIPVMIMAAAFMLSGCGVEKGDVGSKGERGTAGLSAYEIYCKHYIYIKPEKEWIDDLVAGKLENEDNSVLEEKTYWDGTVDDDFVDDEIILLTDKYFVDKEFTIDDFHMIDVESVVFKMAYPSGRQRYIIKLKNKGKQNVIDAIRKLEIFAFSNMASPNMVNDKTD